MNVIATVKTLFFFKFIYYYVRDAETNGNDWENGDAIILFVCGTHDRRRPEIRRSFAGSCGRFEVRGLRVNRFSKNK